LSDRGEWLDRGVPARRSWPDWPGPTRNRLDQRDTQAAQIEVEGLTLSPRSDAARETDFETVLVLRMRPTLADSVPVRRPNGFEVKRCGSDWR
jgi:hypothetical protein